MTAFLVTALALCQLVSSQFVTAPTNLTSKEGAAGVTVRYKQVPAGVCEQNPNVQSFSGYADVSENEHIFWWFFEARNVDPTTAPLTVWINGGPGSSSMIGLFQELGPCTVNASGVAVDNPYSWSNVSNMLFIDQPTQTGFSYSEPVPAYVTADGSYIVELPNATCPDYAADLGCGTYSRPDVTLTANNTLGAAPNMYLTLQGFMGAFPQYTNGGFFFATESYGGHYGPIFNQYFLQQNEMNASGTVPINLQGVLIGNGWFDPILQYQAYWNFTVEPGNTYDLPPYNDSIREMVTNNMYGTGNCYDQLIQCADTGRDDVCATADNFCAIHVEFVFDDVYGRDEYDSRQLTPDPFPPTFYVDYLNTPEVQEAIGAFVNFSEGSITVGNAFSNTGDDARAFDIPSVVGELVQSNITVVLYFGDADYNCNWLGGLALLPTISPAPPSFESAGYTPFLSDSSTSDAPRASLRQSSNFAFVRVYESGHEVPFYQPEVSLTMFARVLNGSDIATGQSSQMGVVTQGNMTSDYREGNGTVQTEVLPTESTYDWQTGLPVLPPGGNGTATTETELVRSRVMARMRRDLVSEMKREARKTVGKRRPMKLHHRAQGRRVRT